MKGTSKLTQLKAQRGTMSIGDLAKKAGLSDWTIRQVEAGGNIQNHDAAKLAAALGVSLATLGQVEL
jgi:DNA-binding XRE family transcriptional regulator